MDLVAWVAVFACLFNLLGYWLLFFVEFAGLLICWFCFWCQGTTPQWEGTYVMGWRPSLGLVGGLHSARPRVVSRKAVATGWLGFDTDYGWDISLVGLVDEHL